MRKIAVALALAAVTVLAGCAAEEPATPGTSTSGSEAPGETTSATPGGELTGTPAEKLAAALDASLAEVGKSGLTQQQEESGGTKIVNFAYDPEGEPGVNAAYTYAGGAPAAQSFEPTLDYPYFGPAIAALLLQGTEISEMATPDGLVFTIMSGAEPRGTVTVGGVDGDGNRVASNLLSSVLSYPAAGLSVIDYFTYSVTDAGRELIDQVQ